MNIVVLERLLGKTHEARLCAEKLSEENDYESHNNQMHIQELEEKLEEFFRQRERIFRNNGE